MESSDTERLVLNTVGWKRVKHFSGRAVKNLGIAQIVFGCLVIAAQIVILAIYNIFFNSISQGIWCGGAFIFVGAIGIVAGKRRTLPWVIAHLVFCILVCVFCAAVMGLSALNSAYAFGSPYHYMYSCGGSTGSYYPGNTGGYPGSYTGGYEDMGRNLNDDYWATYYSSGYYMGQQHQEPCYGRYELDVRWVVQFAMNLLMIVLGLVNTIVVIVAATLSCAPLCCNPEEPEEEHKETAMKQLLNGEVEVDHKNYPSLALPASPTQADHIKLDVTTDAMHI